MRTLLIGGSGFLGSLLARSPHLGCVIPTYCSHRLAQGGLRLNLAHKESLERAIAQVKPTLVVHCGGLTKTDVCEAEPTLAHQVNVEGTRNLVDAFDGKIVYFSTDYVFDGEGAPYREEDVPHPINEYGRTKVLAERVILSNRCNLVVRVSGLYGRNPFRDAFLNPLYQPGPVSAPTDLFSTPTYFRDVERNLPSILERSGILHFAGAQSMSRYDLLRKVVDGLGLPVDLRPSRYDPANSLAPRPKDSSLTSATPLPTASLGTAINEMRSELL